MASEVNDQGQSSTEKFLAARIAEEELTRTVPKENRLSVLRILLFGAALVLALSTTLLAGLFQNASVSSGGDFKTGVTTCPGRASK